MRFRKIQWDSWWLMGEFVRSQGAYFERDWGVIVLCFFNFLKKLYLFIFRQRGRKEERDEAKHWCARETSIGCFSQAPSRGLSPQPRHVHWLGVELVTFLLCGTIPSQLNHTGQECFLYLVSSSINASIFHSTRLDTFWTTSWILSGDYIC